MISRRNEKGEKNTPLTDPRGDQMERPLKESSMLNNYLIGDARMTSTLKGKLTKKSLCYT